VGATFQSPFPSEGTPDKNVPFTRRHECLRYIKNGNALMKEATGTMKYPGWRTATSDAPDAGFHSIKISGFSADRIAAFGCGLVCGRIGTPGDARHSKQLP
jgi:hypothetical protein